MPTKDFIWLSTQCVRLQFNSVIAQNDAQIIHNLNVRHFASFAIFHSIENIVRVFRSFDGTWCGRIPAEPWRASNDICQFMQHELIRKCFVRSEIDPSRRARNSIWNYMYWVWWGFYFLREPLKSKLRTNAPHTTHFLDRAYFENACQKFNRIESQALSLFVAMESRFVRNKRTNKLKHNTQLTYDDEILIKTQFVESKKRFNKRITAKLNSKCYCLLAK